MKVSRAKRKTAVRRMVHYRQRKLICEQLEDRRLLAAGDWLATFGGMAPGGTLAEQTRYGQQLLQESNVDLDQVSMVTALDLSGAFQVRTDPSLTLEVVTDALDDVPGFAYVQAYDEASLSELRKIQPQRVRSEALFGPFDYNDFLSREKNGEFPDQDGPVDPTPFDALTNNNAGAAGTARFTQSETTLVAFGNTVVVGYNDSGSNAGGSNKFTGFSRSTDGGATFVDGGTLPTTANGDAGDPVLARDDTTGRLYFSTLQFSGSGIQMWRSDDDGQTWMSPVQAAPGKTGFQDKQWHVVDNFAGVATATSI